MEQTLSVFNFLLKIVSFTTLLRENNETGIKLKTRRNTNNNCFFIDTKFKLHKGIPHPHNLQEFTLPVLLFTLHTGHILFTKRTFHIYSDYIFNPINLIYNHLHKTVHNQATNSTS